MRVLVFKLKDIADYKKTIPKKYKKGMKPRRVQFNRVAEDYITGLITCRIELVKVPRILNYL